jgi:CRISPR-associated protein Cmr1
MFLAGADGQTPELRPASIKGALRFWWRAMHGHLKLEELKKKEDAIFGSASNDGTKSKLTIRVLGTQPSLSAVPLPYRRKETYGGKYKINILDYMAYGMVQYDNNQRRNILVRNYIGTGEIFNLKLTLNSDLSAEILKAFYLLSEFGGLGAKSRNGYGSFKVINGDEHLNHVSIKSFENTPPSSFSALSKETKLDEENGFRSWEDALFFLGESYQIAREKTDSKHNYTRRILMSQPIIVNGGEVQETILKNGRHAKPYFMSVSKTSDGKYAAKLISMPYNYLENHPNHHKKHIEEYWDTIKEFNKNLGLR